MTSIPPENLAAIITTAGEPPRLRAAHVEIPACHQASVTDGERRSGAWRPAGPLAMRHAGIVNVKLAAECPQRGDLAGDIAVMLEANPAAVAFFGVLARFSRKASTMGRWSR